MGDSWDKGPLRVSVSADGVTVVSLSGEVDMFNAQTIVETVSAVLGGGEDEIVIDVTDVDFMDSQGLNALVQSATLVRAADGRLVVRNPNPALQIFLSLTGIDQLVATEHDEPSENQS